MTVKGDHGGFALTLDSGPALNQVLVQNHHGHPVLIKMEFGANVLGVKARHNW